VKSQDYWLNDYELLKNEFKDIKIDSITSTENEKEELLKNIEF